jgi:hypothetical protein
LFGFAVVLLEAKINVGNPFFRLEFQFKIHWKAFSLVFSILFSLP